MQKMKVNETQLCIVFGEKYKNKCIYLNNIPGYSLLIFHFRFCLIVFTQIVASGATYLKKKHTSNYGLAC